MVYEIGQACKHGKRNRKCLNNTTDPSLAPSTRSSALCTPYFRPYPTHNYWIHYLYTKCGWKTGQFMASVRPTLPRQKIAIRPIFLCTPITFCMFFLSSNFITNNVITTTLAIVKAPIRANIGRFNHQH